MEELRGLKSMEAYDQDIQTVRATGGANMEDQKGQTSDFYRTDPNLPQRFNNPDSFQGYGVKKIHPLYRTWNQTYGSKAPTVHEMQTQFKVTSHRFSELQLRSGMYEDHGFNTALERSKVMVSTDIQNKRLQHLRHYGNQSKEHHHQNSITQ